MSSDKFDPTQETWAIEERDDDTLLVIHAAGGTELAVFNAEVGEDEYEDVARARLASAAPDMARVLLKLGSESGGVAIYPDTGKGVQIRVCAWCCSESRDGEVKHDDDCAIDAALRKAGVDE